MTIFFTSDTHFGHKKVIEYSNRPFQTTHEMDETIIERWNNVVKKTDTVYHLGDLSFRRAEYTIEIIHRLNGKIILIEGNHDRKMRPSVRAEFAEVKHYHELKVDGKLIVLCHFPFLTWNKSHRGSWSLHGHCHGKLDDLNLGKPRLDVGVDSHNFTPWSYDEIKQRMTENT